MTKKKKMKEVLKHVSNTNRQKDGKGLRPTTGKAHPRSKLLNLL